MVNTKLGLELTNQLRYPCKVKPSPHLQFLVNWPGLRIAPIKATRTRREYEKKSKNWLNGRLAPNYSKTCALFPLFFIRDAEQYTHQLSQQHITHNRSKQSLYYKILLYKILVGLCGSAVSFNAQAKKAPFFCKNSIERKGKLRQILQSYAVDHQYVHGFPSCAEEAVHYFECKSTQYVDKYMKINDDNTCVKGEDDDTVELENKICSEYWKIRVRELQRD